MAANHIRIGTKYHICIGTTTGWVVSYRGDSKQKIINDLRQRQVEDTKFIYNGYDPFGRQHVVYVTKKQDMYNFVKSLSSFDTVIEKFAVSLSNN